MELKDGMFVRTKYSDYCNIVAIRKIYEIDKDNNEIWLDDDVIDDYGDLYNTVREQDIEIASENIIDVIKVGDYVNGYKIEEVNNNLNEHEGICNCLDTYLWRVNDLGIFEEIVIFENDIKSVVTKEQFESMKYEVKKDE